MSTALIVADWVWRCSRAAIIYKTKSGYPRSLLKTYLAFELKTGWTDVNSISAFKYKINLPTKTELLLLKKLYE